MVRLRRGGCPPISGRETGLKKMNKEAYEVIAVSRADTLIVTKVLFAVK